MTPDLSALSNPEAWRYYTDAADEDSGDAADRLRTFMGTTYADDPDDDVLLLALDIARDYLEGATGRFFVARVGTIDLDGNDRTRLHLPYPVASTGQVSDGGVTSITLGDDDTALDAETYVVNDGAGLSGSDPRDNPFIEMGTIDAGNSFVSRSPEWGVPGRFRPGVRNVHVEATWGYLSETGTTPPLIRTALARLTIRALVASDDLDGLEDQHRGAITAEQTQGRSWALGATATGGGLTTDRELDLILNRYRRPPVVVQPQPTRTARRRRLGALYY